MIGNYNNLRKTDVFRENSRQRPPAGRVGAVEGGVPDAPGTLLQPHTSRRHEGMPPYIPPYKQTVGRGALTPPRRNHAYRGKRCNLFVGDDACIVPRSV